MKTKKYRGKGFCECSTGVEYGGAPRIIKCKNVAEFYYTGEYEKPHPIEAVEKITRGFWEKIGCLICSECLAKKKEKYEAAD